MSQPSYDPYRAQPIPVAAQVSPEPTGLGIAALVLAGLLAVCEIGTLLILRHVDQEFARADLGTLPRVTLVVLALLLNPARPRSGS